MRGVPAAVFDEETIKGPANQAEAPAHGNERFGGGVEFKPLDRDQQKETGAGRFQNAGGNCAQAFVTVSQGRPVQGTQRLSGCADGGEFLFAVDDLLDLGEEPAIDFGELEDFVHGQAGAEGVAEVEDAFGVGGGKFLGDEIARQVSRSP